MVAITGNGLRGDVYANKKRRRKNGMRAGEGEGEDALNPRDPRNAPSRTLVDPN